MSARRDEPLRHNPDAGYPLADEPEKLTPEWISAVLRARGVLCTARVVGVQKQAVGNGLIGSNLRLNLVYDRREAGAPESLVAKMASTMAESRASGAALGLYERETRFYQNLAPRLDADAGLPLTHFADISDDGERCCLLFENLQPARDGDQLTGCSVADAEAAMRTAAALHAPLWADEALQNLPWVNRQMMVSMYIERLPPFMPELGNRLGQHLEAGVLEVCQQFADRIAHYFDLHDKPWTITHQDYRLDNMLFDARGGNLRVAVLDWQTFLPGPGPLDAVYFVGLGVLAEERRANEERLARIYHDELTARGVSGYNWDQCWKDYRLHACHGLIMGIVGAAITTSTERGDKMLATMINRAAVQMMDLETLSLIGS